MSSLCQNIFKVQDSTQVQAQYVDSLDIRDGLDDRKPSTDILYSRLSHQSRSQAVNYSSVWGWITEESAEMPFKDSLPELQSPCGLSQGLAHTLPVSESHSGGCDLQPELLLVVIFPLISRSALKDYGGIYRKSIKLFGPEIPVAIDQL